MKSRFVLPALAALLGTATLLTTATPSVPIVVWHGMGDSAYTNRSMLTLKQDLQRLIPRAFVHLIALGTDESSDQSASFFGRVTDQVDQVCETLRTIPELQHGFNALGFSQGGLFLRAYLQRCSGAPIHNLVTLGSPHGGIAAPPQCHNDGWWCTKIFGQLKGRAYAWYFRDHVVQAQYFKDPARLAEYRTANVFLPDINLELPAHNPAYKPRLVALNKWVMVQYMNDTMIVPKESAWFATIEAERTVPLRSSEHYKQDHLGLRTLHEADKLVFLEFPGEHLAHNDELFQKEILPHLAQPVKPAGNGDDWFTLAMGMLTTYLWSF
ncbi:hypothetical protein H4R33_002563 [Dimargaris cristalligena]|uniref:Palmitoyl-protein thioesterase 1 n=1 Tax=Dimargaris cristalligena TaxID=215637 RepID=A0A4P9ZYL1_9FUNG|nr:hypothetical protein H4R33_002563 [Dimargaris cristalligena]RKP38855.1 palmitoyl protein thioesterase 1 complexed with Hexadecylsulfonyl fluoride [Dimargaris cristalligena]|eukprot:RKP38855.1 palmitoyl protein thioesterase 1 complexed with Hexadecylsulfonyl fluoride [Dimargaris cristalligena]